ncbi:energy-coupling factor ABC transporter permease [Metallumcola ferriviriculae]
MHMADALISPAVGVTMWAAAAGVGAYSIKKVQDNLDEKKIPLMGVMGAFVFAAQMINFAIPATGSSGHLGGGMLLAILLGPYAGYLTLGAILTIQALFFADGGLLALGSNIFNLGFYTCFIAYPLIYKLIIRKGYSVRRLFTGAVLSAVIGLQLGSLSVVLQTVFSGKAELPFDTFLMLMQPIHLAIGIVEGLVTFAVVSYIWRERPEIIEKAAAGKKLGVVSIKKVILIIAVITLITAGILSGFASTHPDGLEWSIFKASGKEGFEAQGGIYQVLAAIQEKTAIFPDYSVKKQDGHGATTAKQGSGQLNQKPETETGVPGLLGGIMILLLAGLMGFVIYFIKKIKMTNKNL